MNKRLISQMALVFVMGILIRTYEDLWPVIAAAVFFFVLMLDHYRKKQQKRGAGRCMLLFVLLLLGIWRCDREQTFRARYETKLETAGITQIQGRIEKKEIKNEHYIFYLTDSYVSLDGEVFSCNRIMTYLDADDYSIGETLIVTGKIKTFELPRNEGGFPEKTFYRSQKIDFRFYGEEVTFHDGKRNILKEGLYDFRQLLKESYERCCISRTDAGVLCTMALGDRSGLDTEIKELYQTSGISHILAISGLHVSLVGMMVYRFFRKRGGGFFLAGIISGIIVVCYGMMTGFGTSAVRAVGMFLLLALAPGIKRSYDSLTALSLMLMILLWENPFLLFYSGLQFSFLAVLGVTALGKMNGRMRVQKAEDEELEKKALKENREDVEQRSEWLEKKKEKVKQTLIVSFSIQAVTVPLVAWNYYEVPIYAMAVNLLILPLVGILLASALLGGMVGIFFHGAGSAVLLLPHLILKCYELLCTFFGQLPGAVYITGKPEMWQMFLYYAVLGCICVFMMYRCYTKDRPHGCLTRGSRKKQNDCRIFLTAQMILLMTFLFFPKGHGFEIDVLDVGQGDGIYISSDGGISMFVDGGSTDVTDVGKYRILPFLKAKGVKGIDYWFVSHTDADHINGLSYLLESGYPVDVLCFSDKIPQDESLAELLELARQNRTEVVYLAEQEGITWENGSFVCVFPGAGYESTDKNALSMVMCYEERGFTGIFTGDISETEEAWMVSEGLLRKVEFYKAAHHGSKTSNSSEFLEALAPDIAAVSCGIDNSYGHPAKEAVERMENAGSALYYTMKGGRVKIWRKENTLFVQNYLQPLEVFSYPVIE